jgi:hypothetical protein
LERATFVIAAQIWRGQLGELAQRAIPAAGPLTTVRMAAWHARLVLIIVAAKIARIIEIMVDVTSHLEPPVRRERNRRRAAVAERRDR